MLRFGLLIYGFCLLALLGGLVLARTGEALPLYLSFAYESKLYRMRFTPDLSQTPEPLTEGYYVEGTHAWSPDGRQIVLAWYHGLGSALKLYMMDSDGENLRLLPETSGVRLDGLRFLTWRQTGLYGHTNGQYYRVNPRTGQAVMFPNLLFPVDATLAPDEDGLIYNYASESGVSLFFSQPISQEGRQITFYNGQDVNPVWTADGEEILFIRHDDTTSQIVRLNLTTLEETVLVSSDTASFYFPAISDDKRWVAYIASFRENNYTNSALYVVPGEGGEPVRFEYFGDNVWNPVFSPVADFTFNRIYALLTGVIAFVSGGVWIVRKVMLWQPTR